MMAVRLLACTLALLWLAGCATTPGSGGGGGAYYRDGGSPLRHAVDLSSVPPAVPHPEPLSATGNPNSYTVFGKTYYPLHSAHGFSQTGVASWYGLDFNGQRTSSGESYDMYRMTAAHKTLPIPCYVQVTNLDNGKQIIVRVNDRGPFHSGRIIDLSYVAALKLGIVRYGSAPVRIRTITAASPDTKSRPRQAQASRVAQTRTTTARIMPAVAKPAAATSAPQAGYLQVGAFRQASNARALRRKLQAMGIDRVRLRAPASAVDTLYRVRIGPFASASQRRTVQQRLAARGLAVISVGADPD